MSRDGHDHDESESCGVTCPMVPPDYWRLPNGRWVSQDDYGAFVEFGGPTMSSER